jgi:dolichol-phosphate mannosyltransferase
VLSYTPADRTMMVDSPQQTGEDGRLLVSLCTYNERQNLERLVPEIFEQLPAAHVLILDDNSPDGTGEYADQLAAANPRVHVLHRPGKLGLGTATIAALRYAIEHGYEHWLNMDADFSHQPRHLPAIAAGRGRVDVMIGSRYVPGGNVVGWGLKRHLMSRTINAYARLTLGLKTRDNSGSYRCYALEKLRLLDLGRFRSNGYAVQEELLYRCKQVGCTFEETPITFEDRRWGESKINKTEAALAVWVMARLLLDRMLGVPVRK